MKSAAMVIDADGHILEPPDLWEKYLEPKYRDRAIRIRVGDDRYEYVEVAGKRARLTRQGQLGNLGGMGKMVEESRRRPRKVYRRRPRLRNCVTKNPGPTRPT